SMVMESSPTSLSVVQPAGAVHQGASGFTLFLCLYKTGFNPSMVMESSPTSLSVVQPAGAVRQKDSGFTLFCACKKVKCRG
ncbi:MAG: hypothetical protein ACW7DQ_00145, partial [Paraglaciecola chathamensis]